MIALMSAASVLACSADDTLGRSNLGTLLYKELADAATEEEAAPYVYSPFVVQVSGNTSFSHISFKDVGMSIPQEERRPHYEMLADEVAMSVSAYSPTRGELAFDESLTDPANHVACGARHIYVDLWEDGDTHWGYSLWSGCGENDRFTMSTAPRDADHGFTILAAEIAADLRRAEEADCFQRHC